MSRKRSRSKLHPYQVARKSADSRLCELPNVVGTGFGLKVTKGERTEQLCYTVFVTKKVSAARLRAKYHIPSEVTRHGKKMPTDVIVVPGFRPESGYEILDSTVLQRGTLGCFAVSNSPQAPFGVTCAHCVGGQFAPAHSITIKYPNGGALLPLGNTVPPSAEFDGTGIFPHFGKFDAGLVQVAPAPIQQHVANQSALPVFRPPPSALTGPSLLPLLRFVQVTGWGAAANGRVILGRIENVLVNLPFGRFDLVIRCLPGQGTRVGDSGMLWNGPSNKAFGLHLGGDAAGANGTSQLAYAMFAFRVLDHFGLGSLRAA